MDPLATIKNKTACEVYTNTTITKLTEPKRILKH